MYITKCYIITDRIVGYALSQKLRYGEWPVSYVMYDAQTKELTVDILEPMMSALEELVAPYV